MPKAHVEALFGTERHVSILARGRDRRVTTSQTRCQSRGSHMEPEEEGVPIQVEKPQWHKAESADERRSNNDCEPKPGHDRHSIVKSLWIAQVHRELDNKAVRVRTVQWQRGPLRLASCWPAARSRRDWLQCPSPHLQEAAVMASSTNAIK